MEMQGSPTSDQHFSPSQAIRLDFLGYNGGIGDSKRNVEAKWYYGTSANSKTTYIDTGYFGEANGLAVGETEWETDVSWNVPATPGTYWLTVVIDSDNNNEESNEGNNEATVRFIVDAPPPEISVFGNGVSIFDGDTTPSPSDHTDFGNIVQGQAGVFRTFTVRNDGGSALALGSVALPPGFTLAESLSPSIGVGGSDTFTVRLDATIIGVKSGQVSFSNNDNNENPFNFSITGVVAAPPIGTITMTVRNGQSASSPARPGAVVQWYTNSAGSWILQGWQTSDANGQTAWTVPANVSNFFESYYVNPTFGSGGNNPPFQPSQDQPEFWGAIGPIIIAGGAAVSTNLYRTEPVVTANTQTPWLGTVTVQRIDTGAMLPPGETVVAGTPLWFQFNIRNNAAATRTCDARLFLDRDRTTPVDQNLNAGLTLLASGEQRGFYFAWTPQAADAGDYYSSPRAKVSLANGNTWTSDSWAWSQTPLVRVVASAPPKGITVITHGFQLASQSIPDWAYFMAHAISKRTGSAPMARYDRTTGKFKSFTFNANTRDDSESDVQLGAGETIVVFDWSRESDKPSGGWSEASGDALFASLVRLAGGRANLVDFQWHFIGHSRGSVVNSETVERFAAYGVEVAQMTVLDPHDFDEAQVPEVPIATDGVYKDWLNGLPQGTDWPDSWGFTTWSNVLYADNYYSKESSGVIPNGRLSGSKEWPLNVGALSTLDVNHSEVHAWYYGTIEQTATMEEGGGGENIEAGFYPNEERTTRGWNLSRYGPQAGSRPAMNGLSKQNPQWNSVANAIVNGSFSNSCSVGCIGAFIPGWQLHGGSISSDTQISVRSGALSLKGLGAKATHNRFYMPAEATHLSFDARVMFPSLILTVSLDGTSLGSFTFAAATGDFSSNSLPIPTALRDGVHTLSFEITQAWSQSTQLEEVRIDNVRLESIDTIPPVAGIFDPTDGTVYREAQTVTIGAIAMDNMEPGVSRVEFYKDGVLKGTDNEIPWRFDWSFTAADNGSHRWTVRAYDTSGNATTSDAVTLVVSIDITPPVVSITNPANEETLNSASITVTGTASDVGSPSSGIDRVEVRVNAGPWLVATGTETWRRSLVLAVGANFIEARSRDREGFNSGFAAVSVTYREESPPEIVSQPQSITVYQNNDALLTVTATGASPLSYQWFRDSQPLANETSSSLVIANVQPERFPPRYRVEVSNPFGSVTSDAVILTVVGPLQREITHTAPSGTLSLNAGTYFGNVTISRDITIIGAGRDATFIDGEGIARVIRISPGANVTLANLTITGGFADLSSGAGILCEGNLTLLDCAVRNNIARDAGGGIRIQGATLTASNVIIARNFTDHKGSAIFGRSATVNLDSCLVATNTGSFAGTIEIEDGTLTVHNCTVSYNSTSGAGGGILMNSGSAMLLNTTISGNIANRGAGLEGTNFFVTNCTIAGNRSDHRAGGVYGSGVFQNTIIAGNTARREGPDFLGTLISEGFNLIENTDGMIIEGGAPGDRLGISPLLGPLQNNGGLTPTHALLPGSPAIDGGSPTSFPAFDQRGVARPWNSGAGCGNIRPDIGAYEAEDTESARICGIVLHSDGIVRIVLSGLPGRSFSIQSATRLDPANWSTVSSGNTDETGFMYYLDTRPRDFAGRFYRAVPRAADIVIPAAAGAVTASFVISNGIVYQPLPGTTSASSGGRAAYSFTIPAAGNYVVRGVVNALDLGENSFFVNIDAEPQQGSFMVWDIPPTLGTFQSRDVSWFGNGPPSQFVPKVFTLGAGQHQLIIRGREAHTYLQSLTIAPYP